MLSPKEYDALPLAYDAEVVVLGGGPAGVAAAVGAARAGMKTLMIERYGFCGGMATAGMSGAICGLYNSGKNRPAEQIVFGFAGEFQHHLKRRRAITDPYPFGDTWIAMHDPFVWKEVADDLLAESGVRTLFHTWVSDVIVDGRAIKAVVVDGKDGRRIVSGKRFIDATGDGHVCARAGVPFVMGKNGQLQYPTMVFRMAGVDVSRATAHSVPELEHMVAEADGRGYTLPRKHIYVLPSPRRDEILCNMTSIVRPDKKTLNPLSAEDMTWAEIAGRKQVCEYARFLKDRVPGFEKAFINDVATEIGIRQSRTITCIGRLSNEDVLQARKSPRAIAHSAWCIEAHGADGIFMHYFDNDYYEIPYDALVPAEYDNLITAGRTLNAEHEALASARVTAQCFLMGYAAGHAAGITIRENISFAEIDTSELQKHRIYTT